MLLSQSYKSGFIIVCIAYSWLRRFRLIPLRENYGTLSRNFVFFIISQLFYRLPRSMFKIFLKMVFSQYHLSFKNDLVLTNRRVMNPIRLSLISEEYHCKSTFYYVIWPSFGVQSRPVSWWRTQFDNWGCSTDTCRLTPEKGQSP